MAPIDAIWFIFTLHGPLTRHFMIPNHSHPPPYRSACGIGKASKNYLKWQ